MKKNRRGSKIVKILCRKIIHDDRAEENTDQLPVTSSEATYDSHQNVAADFVPSFQQSMYNLRHMHDQDESFNTAQHDENFPTPDLIQPSTSTHTQEQSYNIVQEDLYQNLPSTSYSTALLNNDLYLTDSSEEYVPRSDDSTALSSEYSCASLRPSRTRSRFAGFVDHATKTRINRNTTESSSEEICISDSEEFARGNIEADTTNIALGESAMSTPEQKNYKSTRRQRVPSQWKKNIRKTKRHHGEPYLSAKGTLVPGKTLQQSKCMGQCIHKCTSKMSEKARMKIFSHFWSLDTVEQKRLYIVSLINRVKSKSYKKKVTRKKLTYKYFLKKIGTLEKIRVCQKFFIATLSVSESFVRFCFKKVVDNNTVIGDKRGKHTPHNKKSRETREHVRNHIRSFPRIPAPGLRRDSTKEYLGRNLNITKMYELYKIKCDSEQRPTVELAFYRSVFNNDFNIGFHRPGRDICDICSIFERMNEEEKEIEKINHEDHLIRIITARKHRHEAKRLAEFGRIHFAEYDLKAIGNSRAIATKLRRPLLVYNLTIADFKKKKRSFECFCWEDDLANKGSAEIGSCLYKYLQSKADGKAITFMSDTCASQCRNMYLSSLLLYCVEIFDIPVINHKYFEQGHSQMETDNIHTDIVNAKKDKVVLHPFGFYNIIRNCLGENSNNLYEMKQEDFIDLKYLKKVLVKNAKVDCDGKPVNWLNIRWLQYRKDSTNHIYFKYELDDKEFHKIEVIRRGKRTHTCEEIMLMKKPLFPDTQENMI